MRMKMNKIIGLILALGLMLISANAQNSQAASIAKIEELTQKIQSNPKDIEAYFDRANVYFELKKHEEAIIDLTKVIELNPKIGAPYYNRSLSYEAKGNLELAVKDVNKVIELSPKYLIGYARLADLYIKTGDKKKAAEFLIKQGFILINNAANIGETLGLIPLFEKAIMLDPNNAKSYYCRAFITINYSKERNYDSSLDLVIYPDTILGDLNKALELDPQMAAAYTARGIFYFNDISNIKGKYTEQSIRDFTKAIKLSPKDQNNYVFRAKAYRKLGKTDLAAADDRKAEELKRNE